MNPKWTSYVSSWALPVMMAAGTVNMTVGDFFFGRRAHISDLDVEVQRLSGKRMIAIDRDHVTGKMRHGHRARAVLRLRL